jgi:tRNA A37 threonylcarbamoyladenosine dehydratase
MTSNDSQRLGGITRLYGAQGLERLRNAHVCVVGLGGVGSWTVEALARSGVGVLTLVDPDDVCISNTNRQIQALTGTVGHLKTAALAARIHKLIPPAVCIRSKNS